MKYTTKVIFLSSLHFLVRDKFFWFRLHSQSDAEELFVRRLQEGAKRCVMSVVKKELLENLEDLLRFQFLAQAEQSWETYDIIEEKIEHLEKKILETDQMSH